MFIGSQETPQATRGAPCPTPAALTANRVHLSSAAEEADSPVCWQSKWTLVRAGMTCEGPAAPRIQQGGETRPGPAGDGPGQREPGVEGAWSEREPGRADPGGGHSGSEVRARHAPGSGPCRRVGRRGRGRLQYRKGRRSFQGKTELPQLLSSCPWLSTDRPRGSLCGCWGCGMSGACPGEETGGQMTW